MFSILTKEQQTIYKVAYVLTYTRVQTQNTMKKINEIPQLGFGTFQITEDCSNLVKLAIENGYRHIDTAQLYNNEAEVGQGIKDASITRDNIFLTTKVWPDQFSKSKFLPSVGESLKKLKTDYVDLLLLHWPNPDIDVRETLEELLKAQEKGYAKYIGVSNFNTKLLQQTLDFGAPIITNQVEYHPYINQEILKTFLQDKNIPLTAYCPIARGKVLEEETIKDIAQAHQKTTGQICLRWHIQQDNVIAIPKTATPSRITENFAIFDFELSPEEMQQINALQKEEGRIISPKNVEWD